jgi:hypothetical protein
MDEGQQSTVGQFSSTSSDEAAPAAAPPHRVKTFKNESQLVGHIQKCVKAMYPNAYIVKVHGGPMQQPGIPDLMIVVDGIFIGAEVKHQKPGESEQNARERATPLQRIQIQKINAAGGMAGVVLNLEETLDLISRAIERNK